MPSILPAALMALAGAAAPQPAVHPVDLIATAADGGVQLRVVGRSDAALEVTYTLEVTGGAGNRSTQRGRAHLVPGRDVTLIALTLGQRAHDPWQARLTVLSNDGTEYQVTRQAGG